MNECLHTYHQSSFQVMAYQCFIFSCICFKTGHHLLKMEVYFDTSYHQQMQRLQYSPSLEISVTVLSRTGAVIEKRINRLISKNLTIITLVSANNVKCEQFLQSDVFAKSVTNLFLQKASNYLCYVSDVFERWLVNCLLPLRQLFVLLFHHHFTLITKLSLNFPLKPFKPLVSCIIY